MNISSSILNCSIFFSKTDIALFILAVMFLGHVLFCIQLSILFHRKRRTSRLFFLPKSFYFVFSLQFMWVLLLILDSFLFLCACRIRQIKVFGPPVVPFYCKIEKALFDQFRFGRNMISNAKKLGSPGIVHVLYTQNVFNHGYFLVRWLWTVLH